MLSKTILLYINITYVQTNLMYVCMCLRIYIYIYIYIKNFNFPLVSEIYLNISLPNFINLTDYMLWLVRPLSSHLWVLIAVIFDTLNVISCICVPIHIHTHILFGVSVCVHA